MAQDPANPRIPAAEKHTLTTTGRWPRVSNVALKIGNIKYTCHYCVYHIFDLSLPWGSAIKNLPAMQETQVQSLGWEDPLEKGMAIHSSILAPWTEEPSGL